MFYNHKHLTTELQQNQLLAAALRASPLSPFTPVFRLPMKALWIDTDRSFS